MVCVHAQDTTDAFFFAGARVVDVRTFVEHAGVHAEVREVAVWVGRNLKCERGKRLVVVSLARDRSVGLRIDAGDRLGFQRRRQIIDHRVEQRLYALVLKGRTAEHRQHRAGDRRFAQRRLHAVDRQIFAFEEHLEKLVILLRNRFDELVTPLKRDFFEFALDVGLLGHRRTEVVDIDDALHGEEIDDAQEIVFGSDRYLNRHRARAQALANLSDDVEEIRTHPIHLVDEHDARHFVLVGLTPHGFGLRLHGGNRVEKCDQPVEHAQRALHFDGEINVAGRIDNVDTRIAPGGRSRGRRNRNAALLLLYHPVHRSGTVVHFADLMNHAGVKQNALRARRLARVNMRGNADVASFF